MIWIFNQMKKMKVKVIYIQGLQTKIANQEEN